VILRHFDHGLQTLLIGLAMRKLVHYEDAIVNNEIYRYSFPPAIPLSEIEETLLLAIWGTESIHGESQARLDASHLLDTDRRICVIHGGTPVGRDLNRLFVGFVAREFGADAFTVERVPRMHAQKRPPQTT
jgi:hypothetical protein